MEINNTNMAPFIHDRLVHRDLEVEFIETSVFEGS